MASAVLTGFFTSCSMLKIWNKNLYGGVIGAFNCQVCFVSRFTLLLTSPLQLSVPLRLRCCRAFHSCLAVRAIHAWIASRYVCIRASQSPKQSMNLKTSKPYNPKTLKPQNRVRFDRENGVSFRKLFPQGAAWCKDKKHNRIHDEAPQAVTSTVRPTDVEGLAELAGDTWTGDVAVYKHQGGGCDTFWSGLRRCRIAVA